MNTRVALSLLSLVLTFFAHLLIAEDEQSSSFPLLKATYSSESGPDICFRHVNYAVNDRLPGYTGYFNECVPYFPSQQQVTMNYKEGFYHEEFTHEKIHMDWLTCQEDEHCGEIVQQYLMSFDMQAQHRRTGSLSLSGAVGEAGIQNLSDIRDPSFFGQSPYFEKIGQSQPNASIVEFTVPRTYFEKFHMNVFEPVKLRGWYLQGKGLQTSVGYRHPLIIMVAGFNMEVTALHHPEDPVYEKDPVTDDFVEHHYPHPNAQTEVWGMRQWRQYAYDFYRQGFDVLMVDKRGSGISSGYVSVDTNEMAQDLYRMLSSLESGDGLSILSADSKEMVQEQEAAGVLIRSQPIKDIPVYFMGASQGASAVGLAMHRHVDVFCHTQLSTRPCTDPKDYDYNIQGAILLGDFIGGLGYYSDQRIPLLEAAFRDYFDTMTLLSSETATTIEHWPAVFFGRGLWDETFPPKSSFDLYKKAKGYKELAYVRGPHSEAAWGKNNTHYMSRRMTRFAKNILKNKSLSHQESYDYFWQAVLASPPFWEESSSENVMIFP